MKIQLLGTGGADGIPAMYCQSQVGEYAKQHGGKDVRTRSAALIDDEIKLDFGPDTLAQIAHHQLDPQQWSAILFTHSHDDHLCESELQYALYPFTDLTYAPFTIYGNSEVGSRIWHRYPEWPFEVVVTQSFVPFTHNHYRITPIHAYHKLDEDAHNLIIEDGQSCFLYATDTGIWRDETWEFLSSYQLDGLVIECSDGFLRSDYYGHLDIKECIEVVDKLRARSVLTDQSKIFTTHHAHSGGATHCELEKALRPHGIEPGYDGLTFLI